LSKWIVLTLTALLGISCSSEQFMLRNNDRIIFFGDSITLLGTKPGGYISIIKDTLTKKFPSLEIIGAGIGGNKVPDLQARIDADVMAKKPTVVVVYIGINDVWHFVTPGRTGTPKGVYESGLKDIIGKLQRAGARVILCTPSVIGEKKNGSNQMDTLLAEYAGISRRIAENMQVEVCDLHNAFINYLQTHNPDNADHGILTVDKVHLSEDGNRLVALEILKVLEKQPAK